MVYFITLYIIYIARLFILAVLCTETLYSIILYIVSSLRVALETDTGGSGTVQERSALYFINEVKGVCEVLLVLEW